MEFRSLKGPVLWCMSEARVLLQDLRVSIEPCVSMSN